jgi:hypothetical protein
VALRTNLYANLWPRRARVDDLAAGAGNRAFDILRMDLRFHDTLLSQRS